MSSKEVSLWKYDGVSSVGVDLCDGVLSTGIDLWVFTIADMRDMIDPLRVLALWAAGAEAVVVVALIVTTLVTGVDVAT